MDQMTLELAVTRGKRGMQRAADHADDTAPGWTDRAYAALESYVDGRLVTETFTIEQAREVAGLLVDEPPDGRAWGAVTQRAIRAGLIEWTGDFARAASSNGSPKPVYRKR